MFKNQFINHSIFAKMADFIAVERRTLEIPQKINTISLTVVSVQWCISIALSTQNNIIFPIVKYHCSMLRSGNDHQSVTSIVSDEITSPLILPLSGQYFCTVNCLAHMTTEPKIRISQQLALFLATHLAPRSYPLTYHEHKATFRGGRRPSI